MKKFISPIVFALLMVTLFSNCKDKQNTETTPPQPAASETTTPGKDSGSSGNADTLATDTTTAKRETIFFVYSNSEDGNVNIRKEPSVKSETIGKLFTNGKGVRLIDDSDSWWKVETDDGVGFVNSKYVIKRQPQADEETATTSVEIIYDPIRIENEAPENQEANSQSEESASENKKTDNNSSTDKNSSKPSKKVYYVVVGSWQDFEKAKTSYGKIPDALEGPIYKVKSNGNIVYRMCSSCHSTKAKAIAEVKKIKQYTNREIWIWESEGLGECVFSSVDAKGDMMPPLSPR